jgi:hypothetical protein
MIGCVGQRFVDKQPLACGVDTVNGDVGSTFTLTFSVQNSAGLTASVQRIVTIVSPCETGEHYCNGSCSKLDCSTSGALGSALSSLLGFSEPPVVPPLIILLPSSTSNLTLSSPNLTVYLKYGLPAPFSFLPCSLFSSASHSVLPSCAAAATDQTDGDISSFVAVTDVSKVPNQIR